MAMPGVLSGLNHSFEIQACGLNAEAALLKLVMELAQAALQPGALDA